MISNKTVFVLGAGAHCSYGFPSGEALKEKVVIAAEESLHANSPFNLLTLPSRVGEIPWEHVQGDRVEAFSFALKHSGQASIDAFLDANQHQVGFQTIGKALMAQVLLACEEIPGGSDDDWIKYLFQEMISGTNTPDEFTVKNRVSFITFNYDRFLERTLTHKIQHSFGIDWGAARFILKKIPVVHMYGSLGDWDYRAPNPREEWASASRGIRTIFESEHDSEAIDIAKKMLLEARSVCLLGYGFHDENSELLDFKSTLVKPNGTVAASRYGLTDSEFQRKTHPLRNAGVNISQRAAHEQCLLAIKNMNIF